jgi:WD domain, G-beta repeat
VEQLAKILSLVAIPVIIAVFGWLIQDSLAQRNVGQEYVKLAVSILIESKEKANPALRDWAVDLLNQNSPTRFSPAVVQQLKAGEVSLPQIGALLAASQGGSLAISPDGRLLLTGSLDATARVCELSTGKQLMTLVGHTDGVIGVAIAPDGRDAFTRSLDGTIKVWDLSDGRELRTLPVPS